MAPGSCAGTRIEETEHKFAQIEDSIRTVIPAAQTQTMLDNIGIPYSGGLTGKERIVKLASAEFIEGRPVEIVR